MKTRNPIISTIEGRKSRSVVELARDCAADIWCRRSDSDFALRLARCAEPLRACKAQAGGEPVELVYADRRPETSKFVPRCHARVAGTFQGLADARGEPRSRRDSPGSLEGTLDSHPARLSEGDELEPSSSAHDGSAHGPG